MGYKDYYTIKDIEGGTTKYYFYNVTAAVGWTSARGLPAVNLVEDMMLVTYFLQYAFHFRRKYMPTTSAGFKELETLPFPPMIPRMMVADKKNTISNLSYWIKKYQKLAGFRYPDGRVDSVIHYEKDGYTIAVMNFVQEQIVRDLFGQDDYMAYMLNDTPQLMPTMLKASLSYDPSDPSTWGMEL